MKNDGGPAFPRPNSIEPNGTNSWANDGMTLRDWFAGQALDAAIDAYIVGNGPTLGTDHLSRNVAAHAYRIADALIAERDK
jgi:hypothetical protein